MNFQHNLGYWASLVKYSRPAHSLRLYLNLFIVVDKLLEIHFQLVRDVVTVISHAACTSLWEYIEKLYIIKKSVHFAIYTISSAFIKQSIYIRVINTHKLFTFTFL